MKDPLQTEQTPHEVLGIRPGASRAEIEAAYMNALERYRSDKKQVPPNKAKGARDALVRPVERAMLELLQYNPQVLSKLTPNPLTDGSTLSRSKRATTALAWEADLKKDFRDAGLAHSLSVLWYWWTKYEQERFDLLLDSVDKKALHGKGRITKKGLLLQARKTQGVACNPDEQSSCPHSDCPWREDCMSSAPSFAEMWERVIGYRVMLAVTPEFWEGLSGISVTEARELQHGFTDDLRNNFLDLSQRYQSMLGTEDELTESYRFLEVLLTTELNTAKTLSELGVRTKRGPIRGGGLELERLGKLDTIRSQIAEFLKKNPRSENLRLLRDALSPYSFIRVLVEINKKFDDALEKIQSLPADEQKSDDVSKLRARALHQRGREQANLGQIEEALDSWGDVLQCVRTKSTDDETKADIVSTCKEAVKLQSRDPDRAIQILEKGLRLVKHEDLVEILAQRALGVLGDTEEKLKAGTISYTPEFWVALRKAMADLERAKNLGSKSAADKIEPARRFILALAEILAQRALGVLGDTQEKLKRGTISYTPECWGTLREAMADLERAKKLGSKRAADNIEAARGFMESESGLFNLPQEARRILPQAREASGREDHETEISCLRKVISVAGRKVPTRIKEDLARALAKHAIQTFNRTKAPAWRSSGRDLLAELKGAERELSEAAALYPSEDNIRKLLTGIRESLAVALANHAIETFNRIKATGVLSLGRLEPGRRAFSRRYYPGRLEKLGRRERLNLLTELKGAERELFEAAELYPSEDHIRKVLLDIRRNIGKVTTRSLDNSLGALAGCLGILAFAALGVAVGPLAYKPLASLWYCNFGKAEAILAWCIMIATLTSFIRLSLRRGPRFRNVVDGFLWLFRNVCDTRWACKEETLAKVVEVMLYLFAAAPVLIIFAAVMVVIVSPEKKDTVADVMKFLFVGRKPG